MQQLPPRDEGQKKSVEAKCGIDKWLKVWTWQTVQSLRGRTLTNTKPRLSNILAAKMLCWDGRAYKYAAGEGGELINTQWGEGGELINTKRAACFLPVARWALRLLTQRLMNKYPTTGLLLTLPIII